MSGSDVPSQGHTLNILQLDEVPPLPSAPTPCRTQQDKAHFLALAGVSICLWRKEPVVEIRESSMDVGLTLAQDLRSRPLTCDISLPGADWHLPQ